MIRTAIKTKMKASKVSQKELASLIGITESSMSLFLSGKLNLTLDKVEELMKRLELTVVDSTSQEELSSEAKAWLENLYQSCK